LIAPIITEEVSAVLTAFSRYYSEKILPNEFETGIGKQLDLFKKYNEDDHVKILF